MQARPDFSEVVQRIYELFKTYGLTIGQMLKSQCQSLDIDQVTGLRHVPFRDLNFSKETNRGLALKSAPALSQSIPQVHF